MSDPQLQAFIDQFHLELNGVRFWTPYWRDQLPSTAVPHPRTGPYKGKGSPEQILEHLKEHLPGDPPSTGEDFRVLMRTLHLGVDCSGFAFHVIERWLRKTRSVELADNLFKPRKDLLADFENPIYTHPPHITREKLEALPEQVSLASIQDLWGNQPVRLAGVYILAGDESTDRVPKYEDVRPGDIIRMMGSDRIPHCLIVVENLGERILYAHSARVHDMDLGGVEYGEIVITDPNQGIAEQDWGDSHLRNAIFDIEPIRRLKVLADG